MKRAAVVLVVLVGLVGCSSGGSGLATATTTTVTQAASVHDMQQSLYTEVLRRNEGTDLSIDTAKCMARYVVGHVNKHTLEAWNAERHLPMRDHQAQTDYEHAAESSLAECGGLGDLAN
jgi:hypothetical protein